MAPAATGTSAPTATLNGHAVTPRGKPMARAERRRLNRHACDLPSACVVISLVEPVLLPVRIRNLSQKGLGLLMTSRIAPGSFLAIKVQGPRQKAARIIKARVVHATFQPDIRTWLVGCDFVEELRKDELALIC